nr:hypothetical protein [Salinivibrio socompensis]
MKKLLFMAGIALLAPLAAQAFTLDARYQDKDGDLIADIPSDKAKQIDPSTLIFALYAG